MRDALQQMVGQMALSHSITLAVHSVMSQDMARLRLRLWALDVVHRLFRSRAFADHPMEDLFLFVALPEYTKRGHPHWHLILRLHAACHEWFSTCARRLWRRIVPSGTSDIKPIGPTEGDRDRVITYVTKHASRPFSYETFVTSNMLDLPELGGPRVGNQAGRIKSPLSANTIAPSNPGQAMFSRSQSDVDRRAMVAAAYRAASRGS
jgi:hypothetical protein